MQKIILLLKHWAAKGPFAPVTNACVFRPFYVNEQKNLAKMDGHGVYAFAGSTVVPPEDPSRVTRVMGYGKSPVVASSGSGAFFLDKEGEGRWRLTLLPDVVRLASPYAGGQKVKRRLEQRDVTMTCALPDLARGYAVIGADGAEVCRSDEKGAVTLRPGHYRLRAVQRGL